MTELELPEDVLTAIEQLEKGGLDTVTWQTLTDIVHGWIQVGNTSERVARSSLVHNLRDLPFSDRESIVFDSTHSPMLVPEEGRHSRTQPISPGSGGTGLPNQAQGLPLRT